MHVAQPAAALRSGRIEVLYDGDAWTVSGVELLDLISAVKRRL